MTIDEYINSQDVRIQPQLVLVRETIRKALPGVEEKISWGMPTWWKNHNIIHFAAAKKHIGIYPGAEAVEHFATRLKTEGYGYSKGAVRIPYSNHLPLGLIREMAEWCLEHNSES